MNTFTSRCEAVLRTATVVCLFGTTVTAIQVSSPQQTERILDALRADAIYDTVEERWNAAVEIMRSETLRENEQIRMALIAALDRANDAYEAYWLDPAAEKYSEAQGELSFTLIDAVNLLNDNRAIPSLVRSVHAGPGARVGLVAFGDAAVDPVLAAWSARPKTDNRMYFNCELISALAEMLAGGQLGTSSRARIRRVAEEALAMPDFYSCLVGGMELAVLLQDSELVAQVEAIARDPLEVQRRGIEESNIIESVRRDAQDFLDGRGRLFQVESVSETAPPER